MTVEGGEMMGKAPPGLAEPAQFSYDHPAWETSSPEVLGEAQVFGAPQCGKLPPSSWLSSFMSCSRTCTS